MPGRKDTGLCSYKSKRRRISPVYYKNRKITDAKRKYHSYELEALAIMAIVKKFRIYLLGIKFRIITNCSAL